MHEHDAARDGGADVIFAGGGAAACVAAGRLARTAPKLKIVVIEGGKNNLDDPTVVNPALFISHLMPGSRTALFYRSNPSHSVGGREIIVPAGGMLGGGSSINLSMYTRAQALDYDSWNTPGWTAKDMVPLCNKTETYYPGSESLGACTHGSTGPIKVSDGGFRGKSENAVMETLSECGMEQLSDINDFESVGGFMKLPRYVSPEGRRQDAAHCYIHSLPQDGNAGQNLHLLLNSTVTRVLFDKTLSPPRAIGVEYRPTDSTGGDVHTLKAAKLVVVASGALGTPQILERSGVGRNTLLNQLHIDTVVDLPGVGENYQDHHLVTSSYKTSLPPEETLDSLASGRKDVGAAISNKDPQLGWNTIDVAGKLRPSDCDAQDLGPEFYALWQKDWVSQPRKPMVIMNFINTFVGNPSDVDANTQHLTIGSISLYPYSRGSIHINDSVNGYDFNSGFLESDADVKKQVWGYKLARKIARALPFFDGEVAAAHPQYAADSSAAVMTSAACPKNVVYSSDDDKAIESWIRNTVSTTWHSLGTCAMKPRKMGGVVDSQLNVHGTQGLKIVDLSIAPENIGANVANTAFAIGEKAALIISGELGIV